MEITKQSGRRGSPVKKVDDAVDGHNYYIINGDDAAAKAAVHFIDFYGGLAQYSPVTSVGGVEKVGSVEGFFFVRNAADMSVKGDGQGDSTVHSGWAMYIWDAKDYISRKPATNAGWVKITQQGDMDWDITDELKAMFVLKTVYNARVNEVDTRFSQDEAVLKQVNNRLTTIEINWDEGDDVHGKAHTHTNKEVLDELSDQYTFLYYRGRPISGNSYVYDHVEYRTETGQKEIVWCDPTVDEEEWTHEIVKNSDEIAQKFLNTAMARIGLSLFVIEVDGSISIYKYDRDTECAEGTEIWDEKNRVIFDPCMWPPCNIDNLHARTKYFMRGTSSEEWTRVPTKAQIQLEIDLDAGQAIAGLPQYSYIEPTLKLSYKFAQTIVADNHGIAEYVETLPTATKWHYGRGCWVPLKDDGEHIVGHLHKCVEEAVTEGDYADASGEKLVDGTTYYVENDSGEIVPTSSILVTRCSDGYDYICPASKQPGGKPILREGVEGQFSHYRYYWLDIHDSGSSISTVGAAFTVSYAEDTTLWKTIHLFWKDPEDTTTVSGIPVKWSQTVLVRKYGSAPTSINDGVVITTSSTRNEHFASGVTDVIPQTNETVYYGLFSKSKAGGYYAASDAVAPTKLDWASILTIIRAGNADKVFAIGDEIVLPSHSTYGDIVCEVVAVNKANNGASANGLLVVSKDVICSKYFDCVEPNQTSEGVENPEWTGSTARGSNGYLKDSMHDVSSLNIVRWLNSADTDWWAVPTGAAWDQQPKTVASGYAISENVLEPGFLYGFDEDMRSIFKSMNAETDGTTIVDIDDIDLKVSLPMYNSFYFTNITKYKQSGKTKAHVEWGTLTGVASAVTEQRSRINYGFKTIAYNSTDGIVDNTKIPESSIGIAPMFFIG